ncbi:MAG: HAMP domain-containing histidine kinase [Bacteroidetes bacterium]|jgi:two-component system, NtrC family, sensor kinase|nr:HAMP domain-containing histidine kinase [Bacteroidota bacterium]MBT6685597.1 HAMP domain-containing histidine kinase [Bacteroidota bacterium]MBT7142686.1 HAMP domain-containing histidine kinase [Bacteroidota bacterium]MBT7490924.1 HAMP domain-containing histidine kinase [Bacteroidota bacterium]
MNRVLKNIKKIQLPLFWKFSIAIVIVVIIFGTININLLSKSIYEINKFEITKHELFVARTIASRVIDPFMYEDIVTLNIQIEEIKSMDSSIAYILILDNDYKVLAHTFQYSVPKELLFVNKLNGKNLTKILIKNNKNQLINDIAIPLLGNNIGEVHVGMYEREIRDHIRQKIEALIMMIGFFLILGIIGAFVLSYYVTSPVKEIVRFASKTDIEIIKKTADKELRISRKLNIIEQIFPFTDEIDTLIIKFNEMIFRLKKNSNELENTQLLLLHKEKMASIGTLSSGMAHEINTPIAGILYSIKRIKKRPDDKEQLEKYLPLMEDATQRVNNIIQALLNFSRNYDFKLNKVNIREIIENTLMVISFKLEKEQIAIKQQYEVENLYVYGSKNHLEQVFINILLNGIYAIKKKLKNYNESNISIAVRNILNKTEIEIKDSGTGISDKDINRIFEPFYTTKGVGEGTGLGLSVSYNIIKAHKGDIKVKSELNKGTSIIIILNTLNQ